MLIETVLLVVGLAIAGAWGTEKVVDVKKHNATLQADRYAQCVAATKDPRQCRNLEN
jgi:hypothetical protein